MADEGDHQLALASEPGDASPAKRQRQVIQTTDSDLATTIHNAISASLASQLAVHLDPITHSLRCLQDGQVAQDQKMSDMERENAMTRVSITEMDEAHTKRMDGLQAEILELQKKISESAPVSPTSPGMSRDYRAVPPVEEESFDLVVGGWKAGRSRESVSEQLNSILSAHGLSESVQKIDLFGRKPEAGKIVLCGNSCATNEAKRDAQISSRDAIRAVLPESWWVTLDKPPYMRKICKAIAMLSHFLESKLGLAKKDLVVGSWNRARTFLGESQITRRLTEAAVSQHEKIILSDAKTSVTVAADLQQIAAFTNRTVEDVAVLWRVHFA